VNLRTLQASETRVLEQATAAVEIAVNDAIRNHGIVVENPVAEAAGIFRGGTSGDISWN